MEPDAEKEPSPLEERYKRGRQRLEQILGRHRGRLARTAVFRFLAFISGLGAPVVLIFVFPERADALAVTLSALPGLVVFVVLFFYFHRLHGRIRQTEGHLAEYRDCLTRFDPEWFESDAFPTHPREGFAELVEEHVDHAYGADLSLFGRFSLFQYLNRATTPGGENELARLLLGQPDEEALDEEFFARRQAGIRALSRLRVFRMRFRRQGRTGAFDAIRDRREDWLEEIRAAAPSSLAGILIWPATLLAAFTLLSYFAFVLELARPYFVLTLPLQIVLFIWSTLTSGRLARAWGAAAERLEVYAGLFRVCADYRPMDPFLSGFSVFPRKRAPGAPDPGTPYAKILGLARLAGYFTFRKNPIVHVVLGVFFQYELFILRALDRWRQDNMEELPHWLADLSRLDAVLSLAEFAADHPDYIWPRFAPEFEGEAASTLVEETGYVPRFSLAARDLAHPLLTPDSRVGNSFVFEPDQGLWLISGSNMSGKSTFLRSVGVALLLAMLGAPVCASGFVFRPVRLWTSITVRDDLRRSLSLFYSEVKRIRMILDEANERRPPLFYLIDEMLHGTNSRDRNIACRSILRQLRERGAAGMITTHDLDLLDLCGAEADVHCAHFEEIIIEDRMSFDYKLKDGPVARSNALKILEMEGIDI